MSNVQKIRYSPAQIAEAIGQYRPNEDQEKVITAPINQPMMAIAGAGAGKTATMAFRVVYLVANALVAPDRVLGLTFSNKADRELSSRVNNYLQRLADNPDFPEVAEYLTDSETGGLSRPVTSTYNAFANQIVGQYGSRLGVSPACILLDEARRWQIMYEIVSNWPQDLSADISVGSAVDRALAIGSQLRDQLLETEEVRSGLEQMRNLYSGGKAQGNSKKPSGNLAKLLESLTQREELLAICSEYEKYKKQNGYIEYADQIYYAAKLVKKFPDIRQQLRERYDVILLDEFQDTSIAQLELFSSIFAGKGAMAVGDPNQAIYGWRGASELSMRDFLTAFGVPSGEVYKHVNDMPITYRNREAVLAVANQVVRPLKQLAEGVSTQEIDKQIRALIQARQPETKLGPAPSPDTFAPPASSVKAKELVTCPQKRDNPGNVEMYFFEDSEKEAERIADFFAERWQLHEEITAKNKQLPPDQQESLPTGAILLRKHSQGPLITQALRRKGLPVEVTGVSGLMYDPAVADVIAALQVASDAGRGDSLMRLITGCGISPADIDLLWRWAAHLANPDSNPDIRPQAYLMDAVDNLPDPGWTINGAGSTFSVEAHRRLDILRSQLVEVRRHIHDPLGALVQHTIFALCLDLDVKVRPDGGVSQGCLDSFVKVAREYETSGGSTSLPSFLDWLRMADEHERGLDMPIQEPNPNAIQVMTIYAAKGLEWTWVAVPGLDEPPSPGKFGGNLPDRPISVTKGECKTSSWTTDPRMIPYDLRPDKEVLPTIERGLEESGYDFDTGVFSENAKVITSYQLALGFHSQLADRRVAYVAFTRAESELLLTGSEHSGTAKTRRVPSQFLAEIDSSGKMRELRNSLADEDDEWEVAPRYLLWPGDPSSELTQLSAAAAELSELTANIHAHPYLHRLLSAPGEKERLEMAATHSSWMQQALQLTRDQRSEWQLRNQVELPISAGVTRARRLQEDPAGFALSQRRPLPDFPTGGATLGTLFHEWVDQELRGNEYPLSKNLDKELLNELGYLQKKWRSGQVNPRRGWEYIDSEVEFAAPMVTKIVARIDAIMRNPKNGKLTIIDWKTDSLELDSSGQIGGNSQQAVAKYVQQINTYRLVYAFSKGLRLEDIDAALYFVRFDLLCPLDEWHERLHLPQKLEELFPDLL
ncbi:ATP-dependent DNA helicase [Varibaculum vaginae]|uniref:ATP-dependent DNA helicase n=1 Tax=Varibaculum vaginae TaxID=2364797 RepID=UPI000F08E0E1|nr:ATP-dependent DNA helicase [Varibaculum vaginae]